MKTGRSVLAPVSADAVVVRGLGSLALLTQGLWMLADPRQWPMNQSVPAVAVAVGLSIITWLVLLVAHLRGSRAMRRWARWADVGAVFVAAVAVLWSMSQADAVVWADAATLPSLTAGLAGLLFPVRYALGWIVGIVFLQAAFIFEVDRVGYGTFITPQDLLFPGNTLSIGILTMAARYALTRDARRADSAAAGLAKVERDRMVADGVDSAVGQQERLLHETVLNTLTAIDRGGLTGTPELRERLVDRCRESVEVLRALRGQVRAIDPLPAGGHHLETGLVGSLTNLRAAGVIVHLDSAPIDGIPDLVVAALRTAVREALSNVLRHAGATEVWLTVHRLPGVGGPGVAISVVDNGRGFDADVGSGRFGIRGAIHDPLAEVGGTSHVESRSHSGSSVHLSWEPSPPATDRIRFRPAAAAFAIPVLASFGTYTALTVALTWSEFELPGPNGAAFAIFALLAVLVSLVSLRGPLPWVVVLIVAGISPVVYQLQHLAIGSAAVGPWTDWSSAAIAALFFVIAATGPPWAWLVTVIAWLLIQGDPLGELMRPGTAIIVAAALFGRSTRRNAAVLDHLRADQLEQEAALAVSEASLYRIQRRYGVLEQSGAIDLLEGIAAGRLDPDSMAVRTDAALEERFVRTTIRIDPGQDPVHALASQLAGQARRRGVFLDIDLSDTVAVPAREVERCGPSLARAVDSSVPGQVARLTARAEGDAIVIRLLAPVARGDRERMRNLSLPGAEVDPADPDDPMMLWEFRQAIPVSS